MGEHLMIPEPARVRSSVRLTEDTIMLELEINGKAPYLPGQFMELSVFGVGECPISITSTPSRPGGLQFAIRDVGTVTHALHNIEPGEEIGIRGPFGNGFPVKDLEGGDILFIAGGIGLAPLRSLIDFVLDHRKRYGQVDIVYGARTPDLLCFIEDHDAWRSAPRTRLHLTVDAEVPGWTGKVGFVPKIVNDLALPPGDRSVIVCGPPIMIKFVLADLAVAGYADRDIITTLELKMKCGVGKCGRCNIGPKYVCRDGPVFRLDEIKTLKAEF